MMKRLHRLRRLWRLAGKEPRKLELMLEMPEVVVNAIPDDSEDEPGAFFPEATVQEHKDMEDEESGLKAWFDRLKRD